MFWWLFCLGPQGFSELFSKFIQKYHYYNLLLQDRSQYGDYFDVDSYIEIRKNWLSFLEEEFKKCQVV